MAAYVFLERVSKRYRQGDTDVIALDALSLSIPRGQMLSIVGPSGSGKSSLIHLVGGMDAPSDGLVTVDGRRLDARRQDELAAWRAATIGFVFQRPFLMPTLTAADNVEIPLMLTGLGSRARVERVHMALDLVGLSDRRDHRPSQLSGGQEQRVAIARAIVADPPLLICDEPTGNLDRGTADDVLALLQALNRETGKTILIVTHDLKVSAYVDRTVEIEKGRLIRDSASEVSVTVA